MVNFYEVYDVVEEFDVWEHEATNAEDGYAIWRRTDDLSYELAFYNWDLIGYSEDPCGLRVFHTINGESETVLECILEGENDVVSYTRDFLDEVEYLIQ